MRPIRKSTRLRGYDYRQAGAYFCTICVHRNLRRRAVWGRIERGEILLNRFGAMVWECWHDLPNHHKHVALDAFVVMPNHVHAILFLTEANFDAPYEAAFEAPLANSLSSIIGSFKAAVTRRVNAARGAKTTVWQQRFFDRIIRDQNECDAIRRYIIENPLNWPYDRCNPAHPDFEMPWHGISPDTEK